MVYRGKPSAGCENCRKAKKKCTLELPACSRCAKLNKQCSGYRDTTGLQIQDETLSVTRKAERKNAHPSSTVDSGPSKIRSQTATPVPDPRWVDAASSQANRRPPVPIKKHAFMSRIFCTPHGTSRSLALHSESSSSSEDTVDSPPESGDWDSVVARPDWNDTRQWDCNPYNIFGTMSIPTSLGPKPDDVAVSYFLNYFTADGHWDYIVKHAARPVLDPCLTLAIKACGMAALENVKYIPGGRAWSRNSYMKAIGLLNEALRDPVRSKKDESLMAVTMLSFLEVSCPWMSFTIDETDTTHRTSFVIASNLFCRGRHISQALRSYSR